MQKVHPTPPRHILTPLRVLEAVAPSGATAWASKLSERDYELMDGLEPERATSAETDQWRSATRKLERAGRTKWSSAITLLMDAGWTIIRAE